MSKKPYTREDLPKPKVKGLAVHNAVLLTNKAFFEYEEKLDFYKRDVYPEIQNNTLWFVRDDCAVVCIAGEDDAKKFAPLKTARNLTALTIKYSPIGFLIGKRRAKGIGFDYEVVQAPKVEGGRK